MRRAFASSVLSLLLLVTLVGGGCISCEQYFMFGGAKSCCSSDGHCKTKTPTKQNPGRACAQVAFDHHKSIDQHIVLPTLTVTEIDAPRSAIESVERWHGLSVVEPSPPDLQILHSIFLI